MECGYSIRRAVEADIDTLIDFTVQEAAEAEQVSLNVESVAVGVRGGFATPPLSTYWVAVTPSGSVVASTSVVEEWSNFYGGHYWWIQGLYIVPEHRGRGLLEILLEHLGHASRSAGAAGLRLYVHRSNRRAIRGYTRCGFVEAPYLMMTMPSRQP